jgi:hypothetical protein
MKTTTSVVLSIIVFIVQVVQSQSRSAPPCAVSVAFIKMDFSLPNFIRQSALPVERPQGGR